MAPPSFSSGPLWGTGESGFLAVPKRKLRADLRFRRKIHGSCCDPEYALNLHRPNYRTLGATQPTERGYFLITAFRLLRQHGSFAWQIAWMCCKPGMPVCQAAGAMCKPRPAPLTLKWRHFETPSIVCAVGWPLVAIFPFRS
jgi:hypothetical protein